MYSKIEEFVVYAQIEHLKRFMKSKKDEPVIDLKKIIMEYNLNPILKEIQRNFQKFIHNTQVTKKLDSDYNAYLDRIEYHVQFYNELEQRVFGLKVDKIKKQLELKTLSANVLTKIPEKSVKNKLENLNGKPNWFPVGIFFAIGEIDKLMEKHNNIVQQVANELFGDEESGYRPYINQSWHNRPGTDKNIFSSTKKINEIIEYCEARGIAVNERFTT
jgi:hypothetical protein